MTERPQPSLRRRGSVDRRISLAGLAFDSGILECCLRRDPDDTEVLAELAETCTRLRRYRRGLQLDRRLVRRRPKDPFARYNLACSLVLTGDLPGAAQQLLTAARLGYRDLEHLLRDPDLRRLRRDPSFVELRTRLEQIVRESPHA
jgi:hypothetical protein